MNDLNRTNRLWYLRVKIDFERLERVLDKLHRCSSRLGDAELQTVYDELVMIVHNHGNTDTIKAGSNEIWHEKIWLVIEKIKEILVLLINKQE